MKYGLYALFDSKASRYTHLKAIDRKEEAIRQFGLMCSDKESMTYMYAEDYSLFEVGLFDEDTGILHPYTAPVHIISAVNASKKHSEYYASQSLSKVSIQN